MKQSPVRPSIQTSHSSHITVRIRFFILHYNGSITKSHLPSFSSAQKLPNHKIRLALHSSLLNLEALLLIKRHHFAIIPRHADPDALAHAAILLRNMLDTVHEPRDELLAPSLALIRVQQIDVHRRLVLRQQIRIAIHQ